MLNGHYRDDRHDNTHTHYHASANLANGLIGFGGDWSSGGPGIFKNGPDVADRSSNRMGSLALLTIMLLVDIIILECSLEEHRKLCTMVPWISGLVMIEAAVF